MQKRGWIYFSWAFYIFLWGNVAFRAAFGGRNLPIEKRTERWVSFIGHSLATFMCYLLLPIAPLLFLYDFFIAGSEVILLLINIFLLIVLYFLGVYSCVRLIRWRERL